MPEQPISLFSSGPPTTVISLPIPEAAIELSDARNQKQEERKSAIAVVVANWPRFIDSWVALAEETDDVIEQYAYFRIAYHRGLDTLRGSGWKGSGYVRWSEPSNVAQLQLAKLMRKNGVLNFYYNLIRLVFLKTCEYNRRYILWR